MATNDTVLPFVMCRRQFPVKLAFAMIINKAQGQTLKKIACFFLMDSFMLASLALAQEIGMTYV
jgi:hypothetical protein